MYPFGAATTSPSDSTAPAGTLVPLPPRPVPPKREGPWRYHYGLAGQFARVRTKAHQGEAEEGHSPHHRAARRSSVARDGHAASSSFSWQLRLRSFVRLAHSSPHALHTDDGKTTTVRPFVRLVYTCRIARSVEPTRTCTAMTAASRIQQCLRLLREYHLLSQRPIPFMRKPNDRPTERHGLITTLSTSEEALDLVVGPSPLGGVHPEDGPNSWRGFECRSNLYASPSSFSLTSLDSEFSWR